MIDTPLKERLAGTIEGQARFYNFRFEPHGWAIFTVNDATGELHIQSDWGDYSYRWNTAALGHNATLTSFLRDAGASDYLVRKLFSGRPHEERKQIDEKTTRQIMIKAAAELYRDCAIDKEQDGWTFRGRGHWGARRATHEESMRDAEEAFGTRKTRGK